MNWGAAIRIMQCRVSERVLRCQWRDNTVVLAKATGGRAAAAMVTWCPLSLPLWQSFKNHFVTYPDTNWVSWEDVKDWTRTGFMWIPYNVTVYILWCCYQTISCQLRVQLVDLLNNLPFGRDLKTCSFCLALEWRHWCSLMLNALVS